MTAGVPNDAAPVSPAASIAPSATTPFPSAELRLVADAIDNHTLCRSDPAACDGVRVSQIPTVDERPRDNPRVWNRWGHREPQQTLPRYVCISGIGYSGTEEESYEGVDPLPRASSLGDPGDVHRARWDGLRDLPT